MGKHLTVEEKHNAPNELKENNAKIKELRQEINKYRTRNSKLRAYIYSAKRSEYNGLYSEQGMIYQLFGCTSSEMTPEQRREYNRLKVKEHRKNKKS
jgi:cell division protein FtsB